MLVVLKASYSNKPMVGLLHHCTAVATGSSNREGKHLVKQAS